MNEIIQNYYFAIIFSNKQPIVLIFMSSFSSRFQLFNLYILLSFWPWEKSKFLIFHELFRQGLRRGRKTFFLA